MAACPQTTRNHVDIGFHVEHNVNMATRTEPRPWGTTRTRPGHDSPTITINAILQATAAFYKATPMDLVGTSPTTRTTRLARHVARHTAAQLSGLTRREVALTFGVAESTIASSTRVMETAVSAPLSLFGTEYNQFVGRLIEESEANEMANFAALARETDGAW